MSDEININHHPLSGIRVIAAINGLELFGHERGNIEVFKTLREQGAEVIVGVSSRRHGGDNHVSGRLTELGFTTFLLPFGPQWSIQWVKKDPRIAIKNFLAVFRCSWIFHRVMHKYRPTHVHLGSYLAYSYLSLALAFHKVPLVYRMGDCAPVDSPFNLKIWQMAMRRSNHIVANSRFVQDSVLAVDIPESKVSVIYNLAPTNIKDSTRAPDLLEKENQAIRLLYVGAISEHKGLIPLIEAFAIVAPDHPGLRLDVLGGSRYDSAFRKQLIQLIDRYSLGEKVFLHGHVDDPSIFYQSAAIHLAPSIWEEPAANVVLEAKNDGVPSVVFPSGGLPEMVRHEVDGYICAEKSADALADALRWMLSDPERLQLMGTAALEDSKARFGRARFERAWSNIYRSVT